MIIQHNLTSMYGNMILKNTNYKLEKTTKKLSSGYRINSASDNAAGLAISEKMRGQIRGLERADNNIEEGIAYVKTADGVLDEVTSIVQRMRELTVQALNDTNTEDDKNQIQQEIEQLKYEITKISSQTEYNTKKMFTKNEAVYSEFHGGRVWDKDTLHNVVIPKNSLTIRLAASYEPSDITVEVPEGKYTTYELVETIDQLLEKKAPKGTYFMLEYEDDAEINIKFEGGTDLLAVDGELSYLFFDSFGGAGVGNVIGTTTFNDAFPLKITQQNNQLKFSVDKLDGSALDDISITLDVGDYTKEQVIEEINQKLKNAGHPEIQARAYGSNNIELSAGSSLITGLKGNMFRIDTGSTVYDSVFYDNVKYGTISTKKGQVVGAAYYKSGNPISITSQNNILKIKSEKDSDYTEIVIPPKNYTSMNALANAINKALNDKVQPATPQWTFSSKSEFLLESQGVASAGRYEYLIVTSKESGAGTTIVMDKSLDAYDSLFCSSVTKNTEKASIYSGEYPSLLGQKSLSPTTSSPIFIGDGQTLNLLVDGIKCSITIPKNDYTSLDSLISAINTQIGSSVLKEKIIATKNKNYIMFEAKNPKDDTVKSIKFQSDKGTAYRDLFLGISEYFPSYNKSSVGTREKKQGETVYTDYPASLRLTEPVKTGDIVVDSSNSKFLFTLNSKSKTIELTEKTYKSADELVAELNKQFQNNGCGVVASLDTGNVRFTTTQKGPGCSLAIQSYNNPAMKALMKSTIYETNAQTITRQPAYIYGRTKITNNFIIDDHNNELHLEINDDLATVKKKSADLKIPNKTYNNVAELVNAINSEIAKSDLNGIVKAEISNSYIKIVSVEKRGDIQFSTPTGGFYNNVLCYTESIGKTNTPEETKGTTDLSETYVVGRADIKNNTVEIKSKVNDTLMIDFTYPDTPKSKTITLETTIPAGIYSGDDIARLLTEGKMDTDGMDSFNEILKNTYGITDFVIKAEVGGQTTGVVGSNDANALSFILVQKDNTKAIKNGTYILDGVSGSAAYSVFYKTSGLPTPASINGTKDISNGVEITAQNNKIGFSVDGKEYMYTIPEGRYTAEEWVKKINEVFDAADDNGNVALVETVLENGKWKLQYKSFGAHTISDVTGTAKQNVFYGVSKGQEDMQVRVQVGANGGQELALNKLALSTSLLKLDGIDVTRYTHAKFALNHMDYAINFINSKRSDYGAKQNRLEATQKLAENMGENLQAAESGVRDANIADEAMHYAKNNILLQVGQSILAQANQYNQRVLTFLQEE